LNPLQRLHDFGQAVWLDPRQGHYALDPGNIAAYPPADITVERIGDLVNADPATLLGNAVAGRAQQEEPSSRHDNCMISAKAFGSITSRAGC
jgi:hypothetical protein